MTPGGLPRHIAVIMDGNGRWATQRGLRREEGHQAGAEAVRVLVRECRSLAIPYVTVYAFSKENWGRPEPEVRFLFELFTRFVRQEAPELIRRGIRLGMIGARDDLPPLARKAMDYALRKTASGRDMLFTLALSYSGREEVIRAAGILASSGAGLGAYTEEGFRRALYDPSLPDPDLIIRTGGEFRLSNFLLFQSAYAELHFSKKWWPDFNARDLRRALRDYAGRRRRFGLLDGQTEPAGPNAARPEAFAAGAPDSRSR
jgi:undecaprenyl diphosphate synthase